MPRSKTARSGGAEPAFGLVRLGPDAFADEDDVAVGNGEEDAREPLDPLDDAGLLETRVGDACGDLVESLLGERRQQRVACRVVAVERRATDAGSGGDLDHARVALGEQARRRLEDRSARVQMGVARRRHRGT